LSPPLNHLASKRVSILSLYNHHLLVSIPPHQQQLEHDQRLRLMMPVNVSSAVQLLGTPFLIILISIHLKGPNSLWPTFANVGRLHSVRLGRLLDRQNVIEW